MVLPVFVVVVLAFALLISYPWEVLSVSAVIYLVCLPLGWLSDRDYVRKDALAASGAGTPLGDAVATDGEPVVDTSSDTTEPDRPSRLELIALAQAEIISSCRAPRASSPPAIVTTAQSSIP